MEKLQQFLETIEYENSNVITAETELKDIEEWDSMGMISTVSMLATEYNYTITYEELKALKKVNDILELMK